jgi:hypothetical protein
MIVEFTVRKTKFEPCLSRHLECVEGPMPFTAPNPINVVRCGSRARREPTAAPVCRYSHSHGDPAVRLLGHEEATPNGLVVLMRRQDQRRSGKQVVGGRSARHGLHPSPSCTDRRTPHCTRRKSEQEARMVSSVVDRARREFTYVGNISLQDSVTRRCFPFSPRAQRVPPLGLVKLERERGD